MQKELITKRPVAAIGEEVGYELGAQLVKTTRKLTRVTLNSTQSEETSLSRSWLSLA